MAAFVDLANPTLATLIANPGIKLAVLISLIQLVSFAANYWLSRVLPWRWYRVLLAPGIIIHEYSHAAACVLTGTRIREVRVFEPSGGRVVHDEPHWFLAQGVISMAPIAGAVLAVYLLAWLLEPGWVRIGEFEVSAWQLPVFAIASASITVTMAPSTADLSAGLVAAAVGCLAIGVGAAVPGLREYFQFFFGDIFDHALAIATLALAVLVAVAAAAAVAYLVGRRNQAPGID